MATRQEALQLANAMTELKNAAELRQALAGSDEQSLKRALELARRESTAIQQDAERSDGADVDLLTTMITEVLNENYPGEK